MATTTYDAQSKRQKLFGWLKELAIMVAVAGGVLLIIGVLKGRGGGEAVAVDDPAPRFEVTRTDGSGRVTSDELRGKPVVLTFWATWCPSCRDEMPTLESMYRRHGDRIAFIPVSKESAEAVMRYTTRMNLTVPTYVGASPFKAYGINAIPTTILIDADGKIVDEMSGGIDTAAIEKLAEDAPEPDAPH